ncbi:MAG: carboxypeptidase-like regulatory domain-containing protein [Barnesiella sp.]
MKKLSHLLHVNSKIIALLVCVLFIQLPGGSCFAQSSTTKIKISGSVVDSDGPMIGVTVRVQNTGIGTATDNFGKFTLNNVASDANIEFSYLGYEAQVLPAKDVTEEIVMQLEVNKLKTLLTAQAIGQKNAFLNKSIQIR